MYRIATQLEFLPDIKIDDNGAQTIEVIIKDNDGFVLDNIDVPAHIDTYAKFFIHTNIRLGFTTWHIDEFGYKRQIG